MVVDGTPCERVIDDRCLIHIPDNLLDIYGDDPDVRAMGAASYMGMPLLDLDGAILGHLAVLDMRPMPAEPRAQTLFQIFAARAGAELRRLRAETQVREREQKLGRLVGSAMDAIIELDSHLAITQMNPAAERVFGCAAGAMIGETFSHCLVPDAREKLARLIIELDSRKMSQRSLWVAGGFHAIARDGAAFQAEATLARFDVEREPYYTLILRNVNERIEAEHKIHSLTVETEYLREEIKLLVGADGIVGQSPSWLKILREVQEVAATDATVLILGETGTGKEVIARSIHRASRRHNRPLIKVNCAAIPATLIESELFGHEAGAFTGATKKRDGRFAMAHGGTIFLDEVGELPFDLQSKLLRVLQEGEFEPVGSSQTRRVDVRVWPRPIETSNVHRRGQIPRGSLLPLERFSHRVAAAARTARGYRRAGRGVRGKVRQEHGPADRTAVGGLYPPPGSLPLARQRPRAAKYYRARRDHRPRRQAQSRPRPAGKRQRSRRRVDRRRNRRQAGAHR